MKKLRVMFDDARIAVGPYEPRKVYDVDEKEAERLVKDKGFVFAQDAVSKPGSDVPTTDRMVRGLEKRDTNTTERADHYGEVGLDHKR